MNKPLMYDLFCKAGGASKGYMDAGFYVVGVDKDPQPRYIGNEFIQMDAIRFLEELLAGKHPGPTAIAASPPCQGYSKTRNLQGNTHPMLVEPVRELLKQIDKHYIIENVPGAPLCNPILLTGTMFGLMTVRPRLFETSFDLPFLMEPPRPKQIKMGRWANEGEYIQPVGNFTNVEYAKKAMDIDWMIRDELREAIPPAYTKWIGEQLMRIIAP